MIYGLTNKPLLDMSECLVLGVCCDTPLSDFAKAIDEEHQGIITRLCQRAIEPGDALWQADINGRSLLVIQCGKKSEFTATMLQKRIGEVTDSIIKQRFTSATICMPQLTNQTPEWQLEQMIVQIDNLRYQLLDFKKKHSKAHKLEEVHFYLPGAIKSVDLPEALENLQKGLNQQPQTTSIDKEDEREPEISLVKRAVPLINLLQAAIKKECDVLWAAANSPG